MHPDDLKYPVLYHEGIVYFLKRSEEHTGSWFGGPFEGAIRGGKIEKPCLHHLATINGACFKPLMHLIGGGNIQLLYGMVYSGCELRYKNDGSTITLIDIEPKRPSPGWPYPDYPSHLPYFPLELERSSACSFDEFCQLSCQPLAVPGSDVLILIPPSPVLGMSLWGPSGDMTCAQIVFRYNLSTHTAEGRNQCG